jgi:hypothetical protein
MIRREGRDRGVGRDGVEAGKGFRVKTMNASELLERCAATRAHLRDARITAPADANRAELRLDFSTQAFVALIDERPPASEALRFAQRILEVHLAEAEAVLDRTAFAPALAAA